MSVKSDKWIKKMSINHKMIEPFEEKQVRKDVISFGLSSYGYDIRVSDEFRVFKNQSPDLLIDPKNPSDSFITIKDKFCIIPPHSFVLTQTVEYFRIPRNIITLCVGKSTYARCGILVNVTPFEPEWEGHATLAISNITPLPAKIYANEGIAQVLFFESDEICQISYKDKKGKYQKQTRITPAKL
ncbi:MAG: dCTP deaminase [Spirochaetes bacterium]|nr:dCTP deaminase [Spirochaetota bacterium]